MYIPYNQEEKIIIGFDGMDGTWQVKQASVGLINYPLQFQLSEMQAQNDIAYVSHPALIELLIKANDFFSIPPSILPTVQQ